MTHSVVSITVDDMSVVTRLSSHVFCACGPSSNGRFLVPFAHEPRIICHDQWLSFRLPLEYVMLKNRPWCVLSTMYTSVMKLPCTVSLFNRNVASCVRMLTVAASDDMKL